MTIGIDKLRQAAADMKAATKLVAEELLNPDIAAEVRAEVIAIFEDLDDGIQGEIREISEIYEDEDEPGSPTYGLAGEDMEPDTSALPQGDGDPSAADLDAVAASEATTV